MHLEQQQVCKEHVCEILCKTVTQLLKNLTLHAVFSKKYQTDLLQILPREVFDDADGVVAVFRQFLVVQQEADGIEPLTQIRL